MSDNPFFQFYPSDWLAGTRGLTASETGVYITLIAMMYESEAPIPNDHKRLARLCGSTPAAFKKIVEGLLETGKLSLDDRGFFNSRVEIEIEKRSKKRLSATESANARWKKTDIKQRPENANASKTQCERNANQKPDTREEKEEPIGSSKKRPSRLPESWTLPKPWGDWAISQGMPEFNVRREADRFRDYWLSKPKDAAKLDWQATWRNWVRKWLDDQPQMPRAAGGSRSTSLWGKL